MLDSSLVLPGETLETRGMIFEAIEVSAPHDHLFAVAQLYGCEVRGLELACAEPWPCRRCG